MRIIEAFEAGEFPRHRPTFCGQRSKGEVADAR
jgi:hypothetical protein